MKRYTFLIIAILTFGGLAFGQGSAMPTATPSATAAAQKPKSPVFRSTKDQVKEAQTMLKSKSLFSGEVTGISSPNWKTAVKTYQGENGLAKTGSLNRATLEKMGIALTDKQKLIPVNPNTIASGSSDSKTTKTTDRPGKTTTGTDSKAADGPKKPAPFQANKDQIMAIQKLLKDAKIFSGEANGERGDELKEAVKKYQEANSLKVTGGINAATLEKMGIALTDKQKANVAAQAAYDAAKAPKN